MVNNLWGKFLDKLLLWIPKLLEVVIILILFFILAKILKRLINKLSKKFNLADNIRYLLIRASNITIVIFGLITALGTLKINVSALVAGLGLTGFALGFAFKDTISNLLSGVLILIYHPFKIGDRIIISGFEGLVISIDLRYTQLKKDEEKILIPNSKLFTEAIRVVKSSKK